MQKGPAVGRTLIGARGPTGFVPLCTCQDLSVTLWDATGAIF